MMAHSWIVLASMLLGCGDVDSGARVERPRYERVGAKPSVANRNVDAPVADVTIDGAIEYQTIRGFGGMNVVGGPGIPSWETITDLTPEQVDTAFGNAEGQLGLSILRLRISYDATLWVNEVRTAKRALLHGTLVFASPWSPPAWMKSNNDVVGGSLSVTSYAAYAEHLLTFRDFMASQGAPIYAISLQNEPDISATYESCTWTSDELRDFLSAHGARFGDTRIIAAESFDFNPSLTDPILNSATAEPNVDIIGGHIYGGGLADYPLAREKHKELWMTEHYTDSVNQANDWPYAFPVAKELNDAMKANFSAYVWWYIRRFYGLMTDDGKISKRGYLMAQYSKFVRPGAIRIEASEAPSLLAVTAYKASNHLTIVAINESPNRRKVTFELQRLPVEALSIYTTSETKSLSYDGSVAPSANHFTLELEGQSVTSCVSN